jgi:hypothetical protein
MLCGNVRLDAAKVVPAGKTLTICAGSTVTAAATASLTVQGKLLVQGAAGKPVKLAGAQATPTGWPGLVVASGGEVSATYLEIRNASTAMETKAGANFTIDHLVIEGCESMLALASGGSIAHGTMHGLGQQQGDSPISINNASPKFTDTVVNQGAFGGVDMIVVGGAMSSPVFDRMDVADSHCAFHFNSGNGITISNSFIHHNAYGLMVVASQGNHIVHNNFQDNAPTNIGTCAGAASAEVKDNYFAGAPFDGSCTRLLTATGASPMTPYPTGVGPTQ